MQAINFACFNMKNKIIKGCVVDYTHDGKGIVKNEGYPFFIKDTIINESIEAKVIKWKKKYGFGKVINILESSPNRVVPPCQFFKQCGGCQLQFMSYGLQKDFKIKKVKNAFLKQRIEIDNLDFIENENPFYYRNKLSIPLLKENNVIYAGLYRENSNDIIKIDKCMIQEELINKALIKIVEFLNDEQVNIYDKHKHQGYLRQLVLRSSTTTNELLVGLVINSNSYNDELANLIEKIETIEEVKSIAINLNPNNTNVILGKQTYIVSGKKAIKDIVNNLEFNISLNSFYQVNVRQMDLLYKKAIEISNLNKNDIVFDAYCGIGTISSYIAGSVKEVVGVDIVEDAIKDANENKEINKLNNVTYYAQDVDSFMSEYKKEFSVVFLDPPRKGCSVDFLNKLLEIKPAKITYIACDVATQARDIRILMDNGYKISDICAVDMFSQTYHIENIVSLNREDTNGK